jgi:hypothetical protein
MDLDLSLEAVGIVCLQQALDDKAPKAAAEAAVSGAPSGSKKASAMFWCTMCQTPLGKTAAYRHRRDHAAATLAESTRLAAAGEDAPVDKALEELGKTLDKKYGA